jgi:hypothetical protein
MDPDMGIQRGKIIAIRAIKGIQEVVQESLVCVIGFIDWIVRLEGNRSLKIKG